MTDSNSAICASKQRINTGLTIAGHRWVSSAMTVLASVAIGLLARRAYTSFDTGWDAVAYHLPFAARRVGLCDIHCLTLTERFEMLFGSFPPLADIVQGLLWRFTGHPEAANFANLAALLLLIIYLRRFWLIPWGVAVIAMLAIPLVQIHATSSYIDLMTNSAATISILTLLMVLLSPERLNWKAQIFAVVSMIFLGNSKTQMMPVATLLCALFLLLVNICIQAEQRGIWRIDRSHWIGLATGLVLSASVSATALHHLIVFGNPVYPVPLSIMGLHLPGTEVYPSAVSIPDYLRQIPGPLRWILSTLEFSAYDFRRTPWDIDQDAVPQSVVSFRMGGYFVAYVLLTLAMLVFAVSRLPAAHSKRIAVSIVLVTVAVACLPASHELRYYMFWMMVLVSLNLYICFSPTCPDFRDRYALSKVALGLILACSLSVLSLSAGRYFMSTESAEQVLIDKGVRQTVDTVVKDGDTVCVQGEGPYGSLYASVFHPGRSYSVILNGILGRCGKVLYIR